MNESICFAIVTGGSPELNDYEIWAVFTSRELAQSELPKYSMNGLYEDVRIENFPLDRILPDPPPGMRAFSCQLQKNNVGEIFRSGEISVFQMSNPGQVTKHNCILCVKVWAKDKSEAEKIAREKFNDIATEKV